MSKRLIKEQTIDTQQYLSDAIKSCVTKDKYSWFTLDKTPIQTVDGVLAIVGTKTDGTPVYFFPPKEGEQYGIYKSKNGSQTKYWDCSLNLQNYKTKKIEDNKQVQKDVNPIATKDINDIMTMLSKAGWTVERPSITSPEYDMGMDVRNISSGKFAHLYQQIKDSGKPTIFYPITTSNKLDDYATSIEDPKKFKKMADEGKIPKSECRNWIKGLYKARENNTQWDETQLLNAKTKVYACHKQNTKFSQGSFGVGDELKDLVGDIGKYGIGDLVRGSGAKMNENMENNIKSIIKENLIVSAKKKENKLLSENTIIVSRLKLLSEGVKPKNKKELSKFFDSLIIETAYLHSQNYDKTLIKEGFMDLLKGLFGNASTSVFSYFKEHLARWFVGKFTPVDPDSWMGNIIITAIGNIPISEIPNLTNCSYTSKLLAKSVAEGAVNKIKNEQGLTGPGYDILRNALIEMAEDSTFGQKVEQKISDFICPKLQGLKGKMEGVTGKIKSNALGLGDKVKQVADKGMKAKQALVS